MLKNTDIHEFLKRNGIKKGDTVLVHTSMKALGEVDGGCDGLIDSFISYLDEGLFIVPTHTWANVNEDNPHFDVRVTPPCIGALPTVAAFREDGVRSLHPTHSVAVFGKGAAEFVRGEELATSPCGRGGVWQRLLPSRAKILLIGVGLNRNTYIHAIDEMIDLPERLTEPIKISITDKNGNIHQASLRSHISENTGSENFDNFRRPLEKLGALTYDTLGEATVGIFDTACGTDVIRMLWQRAEYHLCREKGEIPEKYYIDECVK